MSLSEVDQENNNNSNKMMNGNEHGLHVGGGNRNWERPWLNDDHRSYLKEAATAEFSQILSRIPVKYIQMLFCFLRHKS